MHLRGDDRGQSVQIGAIILFGAIIVFISTYQAFVVPSQNEGVEFSHNQEVQNDMQELRNAIVSTVSREGTRSVTVQLGTSYPNRALFANPGPPSGTLRTVGTDTDGVNLTVSNASASGDTGDFWNGTTRRYSTGSIVYEPNYNVYQDPPATVYSNSVLYNRFRDENLTLTGQSLVDGRTINLVALNGTLSESSTGSGSVDVRSLSTSQTSVSISNVSADSNVTISVPTRLPRERWESLLESEMTDGYVYNISTSSVSGADFSRLTIELEEDVTYRLRMTRVGVGTDVDTSSIPAYLVRESGQGSIVPEGEETTLQVSVRDAYNNPLAGEILQASTARSDSNITEVAETESDGSVRLTYEAPDDVDGRAKSDRVNVSLSVDPGGAGASFNSSTAENVTFELTVDNTDRSGTAGSEGGDTTYSIQYDTDTIDGRPGITCTADRCTYDFGTDKSDSAFTFTANTTPSVSGANVDFALNTTSLGTYSSEDGSTDSNGEADAVFGAAGTGWINSYVSSGGDGATLPVNLTDTSTVISAFDSETPNDNAYEFVRLYFAEATNTDGWSLNETNNPQTNLPSETLQGEVYFAADGASFAESRNIDITRVYNFSVSSNYLTDSGETLWLNDSTGTTVDRIEYDDNNEQTGDGIVNMENSTDVGVRLNTSGTYPYQDTNDNDADWEKVNNGTFFGSTRPSASFTYSPSSPSAGQSISFDASGSSDPNGDSLTYQWDWTDDGTVDTTTTDSTDTASHTYPSSGTYTVNLTVSDGNGGTDTAKQTITVSPASTDGFQSVDATSLLPSTGSQNQTITFTPNSQIASGERINVTFSDAQQVSPLQVDYQGSAGTNITTNTFDKTKTADTASVNFTAGQNIADGQTVKVWVNGVVVGDSVDQSDPYDVTVTREDSDVTSTPTFDVSRDSGSAALSGVSASDLTANRIQQDQTVEFTLDSGLQSQDSVIVSFYDAAVTNDVDYQNSSLVDVPSEFSNVQFVEQSQQNGAVELTVGSGGISAQTVRFNITSVYTQQMDSAPYEVGFSRNDADTVSTTFGENERPSASFSYSPSDPDPGESITFDASGTTDPEGDSLTYQWDWTDDGTVDTTTTGPTTSHTYTNGGTYTVNLTVRDGKGGTDTTTQTVPVSRPGFSTVSASDLTKGSTDASQTLTFTVNETLPDGETVTFNLDNAQGTKNNNDPQPADYQNANVDSGNAVLNAGTDTASVTYTANGDLSSGSSVVINLSGIETQNGNAGSIQVPVTRSDGVGRTAQFSVN